MDDTRGGRVYVSHAYDVFECFLDVVVGGAQAQCGLVLAELALRHQQPHVVLAHLDVTQRCTAQRCSRRTGAGGQRVHGLHSRQQRERQGLSGCARGGRGGWTAAECAARVR